MKQFMGFLMVLGALLFLGNPVLAKEAPKKKAVKCAKCAAGKGCLKCAAKKCKAFKVVYLPCKACEGKMKCKKCKEKGGPCCAKCAKKALNPKCDKCKIGFVVCAKCAAKLHKAFPKAKMKYLPCKACEGKMKCKKCKEKGGPCCAKCAKKALNPKCDQCKVMFVVSAKKCASCQKKAGKCTKCSKK